MLLCATEMNTREDIEALATALEATVSYSGTSGNKD